MKQTSTQPGLLAPTDDFVRRHVGPSEDAIGEMLALLGLDSLDALSDAVVPEQIRHRETLDLEPPVGEREVLRKLKTLASKNEVRHSYLGLGYHDCITPPVIQRNILENPGWYTQYTPYQAEIAQGRLEALINYQTMVADLTGLPLANASLLDEATAVAEAMAMCRTGKRAKRKGFFVSERCHPQTIAVVRTRAEPLGIDLYVGPVEQADFGEQDLFGIVAQYPDTEGGIQDFSALAEQAHAAGALFVVATDLLALTLLRPPGEFGADIAVGSSQRFGVPLGYGGPHAAFLSTRDEFKRQVAGRIVGISKDERGRLAYRLAMQTREQHIRRDKATSNICTAQVLLAIMAGMYAVYHGPRGLRAIAARVRGLTRVLARGLKRLGHDLGAQTFFDTLRVGVEPARMMGLLSEADRCGINLRSYPEGDAVGIALDETVTLANVRELLQLFATGRELPFEVEALLDGCDADYDAPFQRTSDYLTHEVFQSYHAEHEMLRYLHRLQGRDISLTQSMIPLGSCTMKLNGTTLMLPVSWAEFGSLHPFAPREQAAGYAELFENLESWLAEITGFDAVSLQPNAGAQGEYAGLLVIRAYLRKIGQGNRDICLIPTSAHGTNPASAVMAGMKVVPVACDDHGNIDLGDLEAKARKHQESLGALMITYPSTHGVFEAEVKRACEIVHEAGGQVYLDGANMNAQVGLCRPGDYGADVCHLNLHKTFAIPHGGGGPGMGPICVAKHLEPFLPGHPLIETGSTSAIGPVAAAPWGSPSVLTISWSYIAMMGQAGLKRASQVAILNANYMAQRLAPHYPILFTGQGGRVAHEFILDTRSFRESADISVDDIAKRLMDFGIHAPTMSWPVAGTLMIEPTESESRRELDRFCDAMITIREEIREIEEGRADRENNVLKRAPHTAEALLDDAWDRPYSREKAAYPAAWVRERKFWPAVGRIDNAYGDRHLFCTCATVEEYAQPEASRPRS